MSEGLPEVEEHYYKPHYRALRILDGSTVLYSIDTYRLLPGKPPSVECARDEALRVELCTHTEGPCELQIVIAGERVELVSYRYKTTTGEDPGLERALEECGRVADRLEQVLRSPQRGEG